MKSGICDPCCEREWSTGCRRYVEVENGFGEAIRTVCPLLGDFHTGENNRRLPGKGRQPWHEIGAVPREIGYGGMIAMEPFVKIGGGAGGGIKVWRDLNDNASGTRGVSLQRSRPIPRYDAIQWNHERT